MVAARLVTSSRHMHLLLGPKVCCIDPGEMRHPKKRAANSGIVSHWNFAVKVAIAVLICHHFQVQVRATLGWIRALSSETKAAVKERHPWLKK